MHSDALVLAVVVVSPAVLVPLSSGHQMRRDSESFEQMGLYFGQTG